MNCDNCFYSEFCKSLGRSYSDEEIKGLSVNNNVQDLCWDFTNKDDCKNIDYNGRKSSCAVNKNTNYTKLTSMSISELADWIYEYGHHDDSPWMTWFDKKYCTNCQPIRLTREEVKEKNLGLEMWYSDSREFSYCEVHQKCRFFDEEPNLTFTIRTWLEEEIK